MEEPGFQYSFGTAQAARTCMAGMKGDNRDGSAKPLSPLAALTSMVRQLRSNPATYTQFRLINDRADNSDPDVPISAWPWRFQVAVPEFELPLIYMTQSATPSRLSILVRQAALRGIFLNDVESLPSRWNRGVHPCLPLWLLNNPCCQPYDPAGAQEAHAIVQRAFEDLYVQGQEGFCYLALHDVPEELPEPVDAVGAYRGMYKLAGQSVAQPAVRLLGAGRLLQETREAARLLDQRWQIDAEVWSCPSYTKLAREAQEADDRGALQASHLHRCLNGTLTPVLAATAYPEFVAMQLGEYIKAPFKAVGADSLPVGTPLNRYWLAYSALRLLLQSGTGLRAGVLRDALGLAQQGGQPV